MKENIKVLLVDDHSIVRSGIVSTLAQKKQITVVGEASNGKEALEKITEHNPDIIMLDISLPDISGIELLGKIKNDNADARIIMFTMHEEVEYIYSSLEKGANGYLNKNGDVEEIIKAIETVHAGKNFFSERISYIIVNEMKQSKAMPIPTFEAVKLSPREQEVLRYIVEGYSNKMISSLINISVHTVAIHRTNIMKKVKAKNVADLVKQAIKNNLI